MVSLTTYGPSQLSSGVFLCSLLARRCSTRSMTSQHDGDGIYPLLFDDVYEFRCARNKLEVTRSIDNVFAPGELNVRP
jgi:hypothetical protein